MDQGVILIHTKGPDAWKKASETYFSDSHIEAINGVRFVIEVDKVAEMTVDVYTKGKIIVQGDRNSLNTWISMYRDITKAVCAPLGGHQHVVCQVSVK